MNRQHWRWLEEAVASELGEIAGHALVGTFSYQVTARWTDPAVNTHRAVGVETRARDMHYNLSLNTLNHYPCTLLRS